LKCIASAFRLEFFEILGYSLVIRGAVAAHLMHHDHDAFGFTICRQCLNAFVQLLQHDLVKTLALFAKSGVLKFFGQSLRDPFTDTFATRLIVDPQYCQTGMVQNINQTFVIDFTRLEVLLAQVREHAGDRGCGAGATGHHPLQADDIFFGKFWGGCSFVAIHAKVTHARRFP